MGIAKDFSEVLYHEVKVHAAWLPVTNSFAVGDFGVISDGVFVRMGNVRSDFQVEFETVPGAQESKLDFKSEQVRLVRFVAGASVDVFPGDPLAASLRIEFERDRSFYLKAQLTVTQMASIFDVAGRIAGAGGWKEGKYKVVSGVYTGRNCFILSSRKGKAAVEISGQADALRRLEVGKLDTSLQITSSTNLGLEIVGDSGVVGLDLFTVKRGGEAELESASAIQLSESKDWGPELEDDV
jgi:hypothetical protein